jgi:hypothetical protein
MRTTDDESWLIRYAVGVAMDEKAKDERTCVGLCAECRHMQLITSSRGSTFYLCGRSADDPGFAKYPRLPVIECPGYEQKGATDAPNR